MVGVPDRDVKVIVDGQTVATVKTATDGTYTVPVTFDAYGDHTIRTTTKIQDAVSGSETYSSETINVEAIPPADDSETTEISDSLEFLYTGTNPVQTGVVAGTIVAERAGLIRGRVIGSDGAPLPGAAVSFPEHPELGQTVSRADGYFDLAVNGGGELVIRLTKPGHIDVERSIDVGWGEYHAIGDVVLTALDPQVTSIDLVGGSSMQVAQGSEVTDADGTRQSTLLFAAGTRASMELPDGSIEPLDTLNVRATEFTVGAQGDDAMPADLPATSGYTYAAELSVDEAIAVGASEVKFTKPVINYVDNFLELPVGIDVPTGYYDRELHSWVASPDGRIIAVTAIAAGHAEVDVDGDGMADSGSALSDLGITTAELLELGGLYSVGDSLWRIQVEHFTPVDHNWPWGPPEGARFPAMTEGGADGLDCCNKTRGSIIGSENQTLGEEVPVAGTPFSLVYDSRRVQGYKAASSLRIPLSGDSVPGSLSSIVLAVQIAGRKFTQTYAAAPNLAHMFTWDGTDIYGRRLEGRQQVRVRIGYEYPAQYYAARSNWLASFGQAGSGPITGSRARRTYVFWQEYETKIGELSTSDELGIGGWTISGHASYDPRGGVLLMGDGSRRSSDVLTPAFTSFAGNGAPGAFGHGTYSGDSGTAMTAGLSRARGVAVAPDGTVYIADSDNGVVRRVSPAGVITTFAGGGLPPTSNGDGGPATQAELSTPRDVAVGPAGTVYIAEGNRVRGVAPDGIITTVAGGGDESAGRGDGGPATSANLESATGLGMGPTGDLFIADALDDRIRRVGRDGIITTVAGGSSPPSGVGDGGQALDASLQTPLDVAVAPDGTLYIADTDHNRIRRVTSDGVISTVGGSGVAGKLGDGGPATDAQLLTPAAIVFDPTTNSVLFTEQFNDSVRKISPEGVISTIAGGLPAGFSGDGGPAAAARLFEPQGLAIAPTGILVADTNNFRIRKIAPPLPGFSVNDFVVASGGSIYQFNEDGRHLATRDALTNAILATFGYSTGGRLTSISDDFGNTTTIEYTAGQPVAIVAPFGQRTELGTTGGYLTRIENPAGEVTSMAYGSGGLLTSFTTPSGASSFTYDSLGRLTLDQGPDGSSTTLARTTNARGFSVTATTTEGDTTTYAYERLRSGVVVRTTTLPSGATRSTSQRLDGTVVTDDFDGTVTTTKVTGDPRFSMQSPIASSVTVKLPSGKTSTVDIARTTTLTDPTNVFSVGSQTDTITSGARTYTKTYNAATDSITATTPEGREDVTVLNADGLVASTQHGDQAVTTFAHDTRGRLQSVTEGSGVDARTSSIGYGPSGFLASLTDPLHTATFVNDEVGRVLTVTLPDDEVISYSYEGSGNLDTLTPPDRDPHSFDYTPGNQRSRYTPPSVGVFDPATTYAYDSDRRPTSISLPGGASINLGYDTAGRLGTQSYSSGTITYGYDATTSQLVSIDAPSGANLDYLYDGSLLTTAQSSGPSPGTVTYGYDTDLKVSSRQINSATPTTYTYDDDGLLTAAGPLGLTWDQTDGNLATTTLGAVTTSHTYNGFGEPASASASASAASLYDVTYTRDDVGRIATKTETIQGVTKLYAYTYDERGRLTDVTTDGVSTEHYDFDGNGNRTAATIAGASVTATYDAQDRLVTYGDATYTYNPRGQLTSKTEGSDTTTYDYDELGNLLEVVLPSGQTITYEVDGLGRRISRRVDGAVTNRYLYGTGLLPVAELNAAGAVVATFTYATRSHVPDTITKGGVEYRVVTDQVGSPRLIVTSSTGAVVQRLDYDSFGNVTTDTNPGFQPFGFAGGLFDTATGLVRFGARDYDAEVGRWTSKDPLEFLAGNFNLYEYVEGDPVQLVDPNGAAPVKPGTYGPYYGPYSAELIELSEASDDCPDEIAKALNECLRRYGAFDEVYRSWRVWGNPFSDESIVMEATQGALETNEYLKRIRNPFGPSGRGAAIGKSLYYVNLVQTSVWAFGVVGWAGQRIGCGVDSGFFL